NAGTPEEDKTNILDLTNPIVSSSDDLIELLYSLIGSNFERLTPIDGEQELILSLGEDETAITLGEDQTITFKNLAHLASLAPEDYLSMRLYTNNDAGNILWEYASETLIIFPNDDSLLAEGTRKTHYVKADNLNVDFFTEILGYKDRAEPKEPVTVSWKV